MSLERDSDTRTVSPGNGPLEELVARLERIRPQGRSIIFGHSNIDYIASVGFLPGKNQVTEVLKHQRYFGGTGANVALCAASLGTKLELSSYVGYDFPGEFRERLLGLGIGLEYFHVKEDQRTPTCWIYNDDSQNQMIFVEQGAMKGLHGYPIPDIDFRDYDIVHLGTGRPEYYLSLLERQQVCRRLVCRTPPEELRKKRPLITFDPGQEIHYVYNAKTFTKMMSQVDIFFGNKAEWEVAQKFLDLQDPLDINHMVPLAVRTCGPKGAELYMNGTIDVIPAVRPQAREDTTGAGDAFRGGFYAALTRGATFREAAFLGSAAASFSLQHAGGQENLPSFEKLREFLALD